MFFVISFNSPGGSVGDPLRHFFHPRSYNLFPVLHFYFFPEGIKRHIAKALAMKLNNRSLVSVIVRRSQKFSADSAPTNSLEITLGRLSIGDYLLIEIPSPFCLPEMSDRLFPR